MRSAVSLCRVVPGSRPVPVVEPEVLMDGGQTLPAVLRGQRGGAANRFPSALQATRAAGRNHPQTQHGASGTRLPPAGVGRRSGRRHVETSVPSGPAAVPGVAFLSGGQSSELASARLNAMNVRFESRLALGLGVLIRPRHPAAGVGLARPRGPRAGRSKSLSPAQ